MSTAKVRALRAGASAPPAAGAASASAGETDPPAAGVASASASAGEIPVVPCGEDGNLPGDGGDDHDHGHFDLEGWLEEALAGDLTADEAEDGQPPANDYDGGDDRGNAAGAGLAFLDEEVELRTEHVADAPADDIEHHVAADADVGPLSDHPMLTMPLATGTWDTVAQTCADRLSACQLVRRNANVDRDPLDTPPCLALVVPLAGYHHRCPLGDLGVVCVKWLSRQ